LEYEDAETGDLIVFVRRRGRFYPVLQDKRRRVYIRWLRGVTLRIVGTVDYEGRKKNPIYIDASITSTVMREKFMFMLNIIQVRDFFNDVKRRMREELANVIRRRFNPSVEGYLAKYGEEYSSLMTVYRYPKALVIVVWGRDSGVHEEGAERRYPHVFLEVDLE